MTPKVESAVEHHIKMTKTKETEKEFWKNALKRMKSDMDRLEKLQITKETPKPKYEDKLKNSKKVLKEFSDTYNYGRSLPIPKPQDKRIALFKAIDEVTDSSLDPICVGDKIQTKIEDFEQEIRASMLQDVLERLPLERNRVYTGLAIECMLKAMLTEKK